MTKKPPQDSPLVNPGAKLTAPLTILVVTMTANILGIPYLFYDTLIVGADGNPYYGLYCY